LIEEELQSCNPEEMKMIISEAEGDLSTVTDVYV
jgi:hypothetical protein